MSEQHAPSERTTHEHERTMSAQVEHLTYTEAAKRLGISPNAVRMRAARGKLASVRIDERVLIVWPQPSHLHDLHTVHEPSAQEPAHERTERAGEQVERLIVRLESENDFLRAELEARTEEIRRRDHILAGFLERLPETREIGPGEILDAEERSPTTPKSANALQDAPEAPGRVDSPHMTTAPLQGTYSEPVPTQVSLATSWRQW